MAKKASKREIDTRLTIRMRRSDELLKWDGDQEFVKEYLKRLGDFGIAQAWAELLHQSVRHRLELAEHIIEGMPHTHSLSAKASRLRDLIRNFLFPAVRIGHLSGAMLWMSQLENSGKDIDESIDALSKSDSPDAEKLKRMLTGLQKGQQTRSLEAKTNAAQMRTELLAIWKEHPDRNITWVRNALVEQGIHKLGTIRRHSSGLTQPE
jgi:hypothetical protein